MTGATFGNFYDCYLNMKKNSTIAKKVENIDDDLVDLLRTLETDFACSGICEPGLFWFFKNVTDGPPMMNCIDGIKKTFAENTTNIGIALIISFFFTFGAFIVQYGLWRKG